MGRREIALRRFDGSLISCRSNVLTAGPNPNHDPDDPDSPPYTYDHAESPFNFLKKSVELEIQRLELDHKDEGAQQLIAAIKALMERLDERPDDYINVTRNLGTGELALDRDFKIIYADEGFLKTVAFFREELIGKDLSALLPPSMAEKKHRSIIKQAFPETAGYYLIFISANQLPLPPMVDRVDKEKRYRSFISYSRKGSAAFAGRIVSFLLEQRYEIWFDLNEIDWGEDFTAKLEEGILLSDRFCLFLTDGWLDSPYCAQELESAIKYNKPILPIIQSPDPDIIKRFHDRYPSCKNLNFLLFRDGVDDSRQAFQGLTQFLDDNQEYFRRCNEYLIRAKQWEGEGLLERGLLNGPEARLAEFWLESSRSKNRGIAKLTERFIHRSNANYVRRQRVLPIVLAVGLIGSVAAASLFGFLFVRQDRILRQAKRDQIAAQINSDRGNSLLAMTIAEPQPCHAIEIGITSAYRADQNIRDYLEAFGAEEDTTEILFREQLMKQVSYTRANLGTVLGNDAQGSIHDSLNEYLRFALNELSRRYENDRCEGRFEPTLDPAMIEAIRSE